MGSAKSVKMPNESNISYQEWRPSETSDLAAVRGMPNMPETLAPALQAQYDRAKQKSQDRWSTAYLGNVPETARRAMMAREERDVGQDYMTAMQQSAQDANNTNWQRKMMLAQTTLGRPLQSGTSGYTSAFAPPGFWQQMALAGVSGASQMASAAIGKPA